MLQHHLTDFTCWAWYVRLLSHWCSTHMRAAILLPTWLNVCKVDMPMISRPIGSRWYYLRSSARVKLLEWRRLTSSKSCTATGWGHCWGPPLISFLESLARIYLFGECQARDTSDCSFNCAVQYCQSLSLPGVKNIQEVRVLESIASLRAQALSTLCGHDVFLWRNMHTGAEALGMGAIFWCHNVQGFQGVRVTLPILTIALEAPPCQTHWLAWGSH